MSCRGSRRAREGLLQPFDAPLMPTRGPKVAAADMRVVVLISPTRGERAMLADDAADESTISIASLAALRFDDGTSKSMRAVSRRQQIAAHGRGRTETIVRSGQGIIAAFASVYEVRLNNET